MLKLSVHVDDREGPWVCLRCDKCKKPVCWVYWPEEVDGVPVTSMTICISCGGNHGLGTEAE